MPDAILKEAIAAVSRSLTDFGYPDATHEKIAEAHARWLDHDEPTDIIDKFAFDQFDHFRDIFAGRP